jgi:hypothetical protein
VQILAGIIADLLGAFDRQHVLLGSDADIFGAEAGDRERNLNTISPNRSML